jgi:hypothetical protein
MPKIELAACPHCGGTDVHFSWTRNPRAWIVGGPRLRVPGSKVTHSVECRSCGAGTDPCGTRREAAICWNERTGWSVLLWCRSCDTSTNPCKTRKEAAACKRWPLRHVLPWASKGYRGEREKIIGGGESDGLRDVVAMLASPAFIEDEKIRLSRWRAYYMDQLNAWPLEEETPAGAEL